MIESISTIEGLGGCGKTTEILRICKNPVMKQRPIVYLTYNKKIANQTKNQLLGLKTVSAMTLHSLMYRELEIISLLPERVTDNSDVKQKIKYFKEIEKTFLKHFECEDNLLSLIENYCLIFVDEFQNLKEKVLFDCLKLIGKKLDVDYYFVGDRYQAINNYLMDSTDNFSNIEQMFGKSVSKTKILNENYRSNPSALAFINSYLEKNLEVEIDYKYNVSHSGQIEKQKIAFFTSQIEEFGYVKEECNKILNESDKTIVILSRFKRGKELFENWIAKEMIQRIEVSTIHRYIGKEADVVFIVGFEFPEKVDERKVMYTGFVRAKEKIILTSSSPVFDTNKLASSETLVVNNFQRVQSKRFVQLKQIKEYRNLTLGKFQNCMVDSVSLVVQGKDVPFFPYIQHNNLLGSGKFVKSTIMEKEGIKIRIDYHKTSRNYKFVLKDVNDLRRNNYSDIQVIQFLMNCIFETFDYRISLKDINLYDLDICKLVAKDDALIESILAGELKCDKIMGHEKEASPIRLLTREHIENGTIYLNWSKLKSLTMAVYFPYKKENKNRFFNKDVYKVEIRAKKKAIERNYCFGPDVDMESILGELKKQSNYFSEVFDRILEFKKK